MINSHFFRILFFNLFFLNFFIQKLNLWLLWHYQIGNSYQWFVYCFLYFIKFHRSRINSFFCCQSCHFVILQEILFYCLILMLLRLWRSHSLCKILFWLLLFALKIKIIISIDIGISGELIFIIKQIWLVLLKRLEEIIKSVWTFCLKSICLKFVNWDALSFCILSKAKI